MDMRFPETTIEAHGERVLAAEIVCTGCGGRGYYPHKRGAARRPATAVAEHFRKQGWRMKGAKVRCPECARRRSCIEEKGQRMGKNVRSGGAPQEASAGPLTAIVEQVTAAIVEASVPIEQPRAPVPGVDEKQLINMRLVEVYESPAVGYRVGWDDLRLAQELGCPVGWVADVRAAMFGPEGVNRLLQPILEAKSRADKSMEALEAEQVAVSRALAEMRAEIDGMADRLREGFAVARVSMDTLGVRCAAAEKAVRA